MHAGPTAQSSWRSLVEYRNLVVYHLNALDVSVLEGRHPPRVLCQTCMSGVS
jgi:hypothetical protein